MYVATLKLTACICCWAWSGNETELREVSCTTWGLIFRRRSELFAIRFCLVGPSRHSDLSVIAQTNGAAKVLRHNYVGTEHLLPGIARVPTARARLLGIWGRTRHPASAVDSGTPDCVGD
jgi:hypothetical protein